MNGQMTIRVAYPMRIDAFTQPGGDLQQIQSYISAGKNIDPSRGRSFSGDILTAPDADLSSYDVIHLTNLDRPVEAFHFFQRAKPTGKPIVFSTIHHSRSEVTRFEREGRGGFAATFTSKLGPVPMDVLRCVLRMMRHRPLLAPTWRTLHRGIQNAQTDMLHGVDKVLTLAEKEREDLIEDFGFIPGERFRCVRNGFEGATYAWSQGTRPVREISICVVGRIEARKNQLNILRALERLGVSAVFIGRQNPNHRAYCAAFRSAVERSKSRYIGPCSHDETIGYLRRSRVHVSASWFEVSSLADLEAFISGCTVISSICGGTDELLGNQALYVDPGDVTQIEQAVRVALSRDPELDPQNASVPIAHLPTWDDVGVLLSGVYAELLSSRGRSVVSTAADM